MQHLLIHWFVVSPCVKWLTSPQRGWPSNRGIILAIAFLTVMAIVEIQRTKSNFYEILNVTSESTKAEISSSYRKLAVSLHPDRNPSPNAQAEFIRLKNAHQTLTDPEKRSMYGLFGDWEEKISKDQMPIIACFALVNYVISFIVGCVFTTATEHTAARGWLTWYVVTSGACEFFMRFFNQTLFSCIPVFCDWLIFEQIAALRALFPCVLSGSMLIASSTYVDGDSQNYLLLRQVVESNLDLCDSVRNAIVFANRTNVRPPPNANRPTAMDTPLSAARRIQEMSQGKQPAMKDRSAKAAGIAPAEGEEAAGEGGEAQTAQGAQQGPGLGRYVMAYGLKGVFWIYMAMMAYDWIFGSGGGKRR